MILETRVGYVTTSYLEKELRNYITLNTINGVYKGDLHYLSVTKRLIEYNKGIKNE